MEIYDNGDGTQSGTPDANFKSKYKTVPKHSKRGIEAGKAVVAFCDAFGAGKAISEALQIMYIESYLDGAQFAIGELNARHGTNYTLEE